MAKNSVHLDNRTKAVTGVDVDVVERVEIENDMVYLRIDADFNLNRDLATFYYSFDNENWTAIGSEYKMIFDYRRLFMGSKFAVFNYATEQIGGYIDVDFFEYNRTIH